LSGREPNLMSGNTLPIWLIEIVVPALFAEIATEVLERFADVVTIFPEDGEEHMRIAGYAMATPNIGAIEVATAAFASAAGIAAPGVRIRALPPTDWLAENRGFFSPVEIGRYVIHGLDSALHLSGRIGLALEAGPAFGTGRHESTRGCLLALDRLARAHRVHRVLDVGSGSGILAIAAAKTWRVPVVALDIDSVAVTTARENVRRNSVTKLVTVSESNGVNASRVRTSSFDLVVANILAEPLCHLAGNITQVVPFDGTIILSGLLKSDVARVLAAYRSHGVVLWRRVLVNDWVTLIMRRYGAR